jgi:hypothetical protein
MHSVVIHLKDKPQEWHLVESLFYKVQATKQLLFLSFEDYRNWGQVANKVQDYILQNRFENWQLILLNNQEFNETSLNSLTREILLIKNNLLQPLMEKGIGPSRKILLTLDGYKRNADYSPVLKKNHYQWQMDNFGYILNKTSDEQYYGNVFWENEILLLDEVWGDYVNLKDAGIMEDPSEKFLTDLNERVLNVQRGLNDLLDEKKSILKENSIVNPQAFFELHSTDLLDLIASEFANQLKEICTPPFSYHLSTFLPSVLLKTILKENIGAASVIDDFLIIRKAIAEYSPFRRIRGVLGYAFLLNALILKPEVTDRLGNGLPFEVEVLLREEELKEMYINYYVCLQVAKEKIENRNLEQNHFLTSKYADILTLPYSTESLDEIDLEVPVFHFKYRRTYWHDWNSFLKEFELALKTREEMSLDSAKEGAKVLTVTKRQKYAHFLQETVNLIDYTKKMKILKNQIQAELENSSPSPTAPRQKWKKHSPEYKNRMWQLVKSLPTTNVIIVTSVIVLLCFFIPFTSNPFHGYLWQNYLLISAVFLITISALGILAYKSLLKPIQLLTVETLSQQKSIADEQMHFHSKYNDYLNNVYKLYRVRNQLRELDEKTVRQRELNVLYRWHYGEVKNHLAILAILMDSLEITIHLENKNKCVSFFNTVFNVNQNVYSNPIYSPLDCQFDNAKSGHSMDVYVENSRDEITTWSLNPIEKIRFSQDKVYSL